MCRVVKVAHPAHTGDELRDSGFWKVKVHLNICLCYGTSQQESPLTIVGHTGKLIRWINVLVCSSLSPVEHSAAAHGINQTQCILYRGTTQPSVTNFGWPSLSETATEFVEEVLIYELTRSLMQCHHHHRCAEIAILL